MRPPLHREISFTVIGSLFSYFFLMSFHPASLAALVALTIQSRFLSSIFSNNTGMVEFT